MAQKRDKWNGSERQTGTSQNNSCKEREVCVCVCPSAIRTLICSQRGSPLVCQQLQHETRVLEGNILSPNT